MKTIRILLLALIVSTMCAQAQTVTLGTPTMSGLPVNVSGSYGFCNVYVLVSPSKLTCNGGQPLFDNNCVSYFEDVDTSTYCKVAKITGASNTIQFNNPVSNGFGINLFADGKPHNLLFIFYAQANVWQNTRFASFTAPASSFTAPVCPNHAPVAVLWYYEGNKSLVAFADNLRDNCPITVVMKKDGVTITSSNLQSLCGVGALMQVNSSGTMLFNVTLGGVYTATVANSAGSSTASETVPTTLSSKPGKKK